MAEGGLEAVFILAAVRTFAVLRAQVVWRTVVGPAWTLVALGASLVLAPAVAADASGVRLTLSAIVVEALAGTAIGIAASLPGWALVGGTTASATALRTAPKPFVGLGVALVAATGLSLGLHHPLLFALRETTAIVRPAELDVLAQLSMLAQLLHAMMVLALALATPVLLTSVVVEVALRAVGRGPAVAGPIVGATVPWARAGAAIVALAASWQAYGVAWAHASLGVGA